MPDRDDRLEKLQQSVDAMRQELREIKELIPKWLAQSTQQAEYLDILLRALAVERGWLPPTRGIAASPDFLLCIAGHLLAAKPDIVAECGAGVTTLVIARCLELNGYGKLFSLESDEGQAGLARERLRERGLTGFAQILHCPLEPIEIAGTSHHWYRLGDFGITGIQCLVIDGPAVVQANPLARYPAGPQLFPRLADDAVAFLDDYQRESERRTVERWRKEFPRLVVREEFAEKGCARLQFRP